MSPQAPALLTDAAAAAALGNEGFERASDGSYFKSGGFYGFQSIGQKTLGAIARAIEAEVRTLAAGEQQPVFEIGFGWLPHSQKYPRGTLLYAAPLRENGEETAVLPPLPEPRITAYQTDSVMRTLEVRSFSADQMYAYARAALAGVGPNEGSAHPVDAASTTLPKDSSGHSVGE